MTAVDNLIADLQRGRYSAADQYLVGQVTTAVLALQEIQSGLPPTGVQATNSFYAGPSIGVPAIPTFRAITIDDLNAALLAASGITFASACLLQFLNRSIISSPADGDLLLTNFASTDFRRLQLGGTGIGFPAIQRSNADILLNLADGSARANLICKQLQPASTNGLLGTNTNDNAVAGAVGEYIETIVASGSGVALVSGVEKDVATVSLTAGDWDVEGSLIVEVGAGTTTANVFGGINTVANTLPAFAFQQRLNPTSVASASNSVALPRRRFSIGATTTIRLIGFATFAVSTASGCGYINARRVR